jgi:hypothetical protein
VRSLLAVIAALAVISLFAGLAAAQARQQTTAHASVGPRAIRIDGSPFFPVMLLDQCDAGAAERARSIGANLILNESCPGLSPMQQLERTGAQLGVLSIKAAHSAEGQHLAGWTFPDEPENNGWTPETLARRYPYRAGSDDGLLSFVTLTGSFFRAPFRNSAISPQVTRGFARLADVAGFDLYPLNHCQSDLSAVYDAQRQFVGLAGSRPTFQWIETGPLKSSYCGGFQMTGAQLRAEAWLAVVGGARGIGFFTQTLEPANSFNVSPSVLHAMRRFADLVPAVEPGLVGQTRPSSANSPAIKTLARIGGDRTYVFAVNSLPQQVRAQVSSPALANGRTQVFGERRSVAVDGHAVADTFGPLAVHVYVERSRPGR